MRKIAIALILIFSACATPQIPPVEQPASRITDCDGLEAAAFAGCIDSLIQRLDEIEGAKGTVTVRNKVRNGDFVYTTYEYCWSDFCRRVTPPPVLDPPWYKVWGERVGLVLLGVLFHLGMTL